MNSFKFNQVIPFRRIKRILFITFLLFGFLLTIHFFYINQLFDYQENPNIKTKVLNTVSETIKKNEIVKEQSENDFHKNLTRKDHIKLAMKHSWKAYTDFAWGKDEVYPLTNGSSTWMGTALTMIDSLDLLFIMNMESEFQDCVSWITKYLHFDLDKDHVNVFETIIRVLGGLLSAYNLSHEPILLTKALDLGDRLLIAFDTPTGIPYSDINLYRKSASNPEWTSFASTSEAYTVILELYELSRLSNITSFKNAANRIVETFSKIPKPQNLVPIYIDPRTAQFQSNIITLGARGDSYYEYLLKYWIQTGKSNHKLRREYVKAVQAIKTHLVQKSLPNKLVYIAELDPKISHKMDHLVCFVPGMLVLGVMNGMRSDDLVLAEQLAYTCYQMYKQMPTGLSPEIVYFNQDPFKKEDIIVKSLDTYNLQRPESIESFFYLYRLTKNKKYQDWGWEIFQSFEKYSKVPWSGYVSIGDVLNAKNVQQRTKCESFWFSETLKYLYLLFDDDATILPLNEYLFNTEGHPFPIVKPNNSHSD